MWAATPHDARLAAELVRGIRSVRVDVRAVLTVPEAGFAAVREVLAEYPGIGMAPLPAGRLRVFRRVATRLGASGLLAVGGVPPARALRGAVGAGAALAAVNADPPSGPVGKTWGPLLVDRHSRARRWRQQEVEPAAVVDVGLLLVPTGVDPDFKGRVAPGPERRLYWTDQLPEGRGEREAFLADWGGEPARLVVSGAVGQWLARARGVTVQRLSSWDRGLPAPGTVLWADEPQWLPAVAASAEAAHLSEDQGTALWAALAQGVPLTLGAAARAALSDRGVDAEEAGDAADGAGQAAERWREWQAAPFAMRERQARTRKAFWQLRRTAEQALANLDEWVDAW